MISVFRHGRSLTMPLFIAMIALRPLPASAQVEEVGPPAPARETGTGEADAAFFTIGGFKVNGNTLLPAKPILLDEEMPILIPNLADILEEFEGEGKSIKDVEAARSKLEKIYHDLGYPTVLVNVPDQTLENGVVALEVIEGKVRRIRVTGNRYFTMADIIKDLPTLKPGVIIYLPRLQEELMVVNTHPDMKVEPVLMPGKDFGTVDVELKVEDKMPLHGSMELNNRGSNDTTDLRLNGMLRYDNLWQKGHSASGQFQTSPEDTNEVQVLSASYVMPTPWQDEHRMAFFSIWSDSQTAFGEGFQTIGSGFIAGVRYVIPLTPYAMYTHNFTAGLDYKDFDETVGFTGDEDLTTPMQYWPVSFSYSGSLPDEGGVTVFSAALNMSLRELGTDPEQFAIKRYQSRGGYLYGTFGVERRQKLPWQTALYCKVDGQVANEPLISNEQYVAGGMESVRGFKEASEAGDNAVHFLSEFSAPDLLKVGEGKAFYNLEPFIFYDFASLMLKSPLEGQDASFNLSGTGIGIRGMIAEHYSFEADFAVALTSSSAVTSGEPTVSAGDQEIYFKVKYTF
ncbi:MAG: polypeptide-transport-associated domain-containing [Desulfobulbaceae bacterium]|nr:MAG: polypeptide-transport-associated domain-containing [Desulfobulbaceae bacterium]